MKTGNRNVISANMAERKGSAERSAQSEHFREGLMRENFEKMKEEDLLNYLRKMRGMEKELPKRRKELLRRMLSYEDCIYSKSFPQAFEKQMGSGSVREEDTLHQILVNVYKEMGEQLTSVSEEMAGIFRQERQLDWMQKCIQKLPAVSQMVADGMTPEQIALAAMDGFDPEILDSRTAEYRCNCSRDRMRTALISLGQEELAQMAADGEDIEIHCHFCGKNYVFTPEEISSFIRK